MLDEGLPCRNSSSSSAADEAHGEFPRMSAARVERLETLIRLRKLYRNLLRADRLLAQPAPVYQPPRRPGASSLHITTRALRGARLSAPPNLM